MKTFTFILSLLLPVGLAVLAFAQNNEEAARQVMMHSPAAEQMQKNVMRHTMNSVWDNNGVSPMTMEWLGQDDFRAGVGISQEQLQKIQRTMQNFGDNMPNEPALQPFQNELRNFMTETQGGPFAPNASEETQVRFFELQTNLQMKAQDVVIEKLQYVVHENLTPNQLKKIKEFQISIMSENPMVSPGMFEALDLTDAQKKQLYDIKNEIEPEFKKNIDKMVELQWNLRKKVLEKARENGKDLEGVADPAERKKMTDDLAKKILESNPKLHQEMREAMEAGKEIANKLKFKMFDVLTDEQMERMAGLIDNPPDYIKKMQGSLRRETATDDQWRPGADSWKPGDPIPEEYLQHREEQRRFPRRK